MIDIKWAQANCGENLIKKQEIREAKEWLEQVIDEDIRECCMKGRRRYCIIPHLKSKPDGIVVHDEVIGETADKYKNAGYTVTVHKREYDACIVIEW